MRYSESRVIDSTVLDLKRHEGFRGKPYRDTVGKLTIGYGWNIDDVPMSKDAAEFILRELAEAAWAELVMRWDFVPDLPEPWQSALLNMAFNMGAPRLSGFVRMWSAIEQRDGETAAAEALNSKWARQVGYRSYEIAEMFRGRELRV